MNFSYTSVVPVVHNMILLIWNSWFSISAHLTIQKIKLKGANIWVLSFWYSTIEILVSLIPSAIFEKMVLPSTGREWAFLIGHCFGGAIFAMGTMLAQQMASLMTVSLALGFQLVCYFVAQYIFFFESTTCSGLVIEISGAVLIVVSACLEPADKIISNYRSKNSNCESDVKEIKHNKISDTP